MSASLELNPPKKVKAEEKKGKGRAIRIGCQWQKYK